MDHIGSGLLPQPGKRLGPGQSGRLGNVSSDKRLFSRLKINIAYNIYVDIRIELIEFSLILHRTLCTPLHLPSC